MMRGSKKALVWMLLAAVWLGAAPVAKAALSVGIPVEPAHVASRAALVSQSLTAEPRPSMELSP